MALRNCVYVMVFTVTVAVSDSIKCPAISNEPQALVDAGGKARQAGNFDIAAQCTRDAIDKVRRLLRPSHCPR